MGGQTGSSSRRWIIDAIDGTVDFAAGGPDWGTLIGLEVDGRVVVGVCDLPIHQRRYWAVTGGGAFCLDERSRAEQAMRVSTAADLRTARSYIPPAQWQPDAHARALAHALARATTPEPHVDHDSVEDVGPRPVEIDQIPLRSRGFARDCCDAERGGHVM